MKYLFLEIGIISILICFYKDSQMSKSIKISSIKNKNDFIVNYFFSFYHYILSNTWSFLEEKIFKIFIHYFFEDKLYNFSKN